MKLPSSCAFAIGGIAGIVLVPLNTAAAAPMVEAKEPHVRAAQPAGDPEVVAVLTDLGVSPSEALAIAEEDAAAALLADVPSCVDARYKNPFGPYQDVYVTNNCPVTQRVKVIWAYARDSRCYSIAPDDTVRDHHFNQYGGDRWDGLASC